MPWTFVVYEVFIVCQFGSLLGSRFLVDVPRLCDLNRGVHWFGPDREMWTSILDQICALLIAIVMRRLLLLSRRSHDYAADATVSSKCGGVLLCTLRSARGHSRAQFGRPVAVSLREIW